MKKNVYNKRDIMRCAWTVRKAHNVSMSVALKVAWAYTKAVVKAEQVGVESRDNYRVVVKEWEKYGKHRTYVSTRIYTNAWNCKRQYDIGYVDNLTGEFVAA